MVDNIPFKILNCGWFIMYLWRLIIHFWYRMNVEKKEADIYLYVQDQNIAKDSEKSIKIYLFLRFSSTGIICILNLFQMYILPNVEELHFLWLILALFSFTNILFEIWIYLSVHAPVPDDNGMITRSPQKQESFIQIPVSGSNNPDDKPLMKSEDGEADNFMKSFKEPKVNKRFWFYHFRIFQYSKVKEGF